MDNRFTRKSSVIDLHQSMKGDFMSGMVVGVIKSRYRYLERLRRMLIGGTLPPLMRINEVVQDGMIPPHLHEDISSAEMA